jgi:hypothetical protein
LEAAAVAAEYWILDPTDASVPLLEAKILGAQAYLARYRLIALGWFSPRDRILVEGELATFYDALTGGDFKSTRRVARNSERAEHCHVQAANVAVLVREGNLRSLGMRSYIKRLVGWYRLSSLARNTFGWQLDESGRWRRHS